MKTKKLDGNMLNKEYLSFYRYAMKKFKESKIFDDKHVPLYEEIIRDVYERKLIK